MYPKEVIMTGDMMLEKVYREGDKLVAVLENEYTGAKEERVVDQVVVENGVRPTKIYYALKRVRATRARSTSKRCSRSSRSRS
jgi:NADPH-dependent 2,4-dienoyl-CoA reductase/sulfur reductase-like enzyme